MSATVRLHVMITCAAYRESACLLICVNYMKCLQLILMLMSVMKANCPEAVKLHVPLSGESACQLNV